jgi:hypothetical protein
MVQWKQDKMFEEIFNTMSILQTLAAAVAIFLGVVSVLDGQ